MTLSSILLIYDVKSQSISKNLLQYLLTVKIANFCIIVLLQNSLQNVEQNVTGLVIVMLGPGGSMMAMLVVVIQSLVEYTENLKGHSPYSLRYEPFPDTSLLFNLLLILIRKHLLKILWPCHEENELVELNVSCTLKFMGWF